LLEKENKTWVCFVMQKIIYGLSARDERAAAAPAVGVGLEAPPLPGYQPTTKI
jgi:hypothetical protein